ncbi:MAG TPA: hypothetical protein VHA52_03070 [Candidatus Babeliaceae bacterium]|nr:hypothetical protein [Candidatus Babeliaceae bacterium]
MLIVEGIKIIAFAKRTIIKLFFGHKHGRKEKAMRLFFTLAITAILTLNGLSHIGITNIPTQGRFGDNLIHYMKCKWFAYKYDLDFYFQPFSASELLSIDNNEKLFSAMRESSYKKLCHINHESAIESFLTDNDVSTIIAVKPYAQGMSFDTESFVNFLLSNAPSEFIDEIRQNIQPKSQIPLLNLPQDKITVAVHIRKPSYKDFPLYSQRSMIALYIKIFTP